ncbi:hypothetical protein JHW43_008078 [Diplocarpon mali]|nr:hypothetical protein JHW43_008078 [Diplocarpon mali]
MTTTSGTTTAANITEDPIQSLTTCQLSRAQCTEPEIDVDPWDCNHSAIPILSAPTFTAVKHRSGLDIEPTTGSQSTSSGSGSVWRKRMRTPSHLSTGISDDVSHERCGVDLKANEVGMTKPYLKGYQTQDANHTCARESILISYTAHRHSITLARQNLRHIRDAFIANA